MGNPRAHAAKDANVVAMGAETTGSENPAVPRGKVQNGAK